MKRKKLSCRGERAFSEVVYFVMGLLSIWLDKHWSEIPRKDCLPAESLSLFSLISGLDIYLTIRRHCFSPRRSSFPPLQDRCEYLWVRSEDFCQRLSTFHLPAIIFFFFMFSVFYRPLVSTLLDWSVISNSREIWPQVDANRMLYLQAVRRLDAIILLYPPTRRWYDW